jgi:uncharacterized membrane protein
MIILTSIISWDHVHPVLVHFTTALLPVSLASDVFGKFTKYESLTSAAWWMLLYGAIATPLTALAGWLWAADIEGMAGPNPTLTLHRWLGVSLIIGFAFLTAWRSRAFVKAGKPRFPYLASAALVTAALLFQGYLGGKMTIG